MKGTLNYKDVKESIPGDYDLLPEGEYVGSIIKVLETDNQGSYKQTSKGDDMVTVVIKVWEGAHKGATLLHNVIFFPPESKGSGITHHFLKVIGENFNPETGQYNYDTGRWPLTSTFRFKVKHEEYQGKIRAKVDWVDYLNKTNQQKADTLEELSI